MSRVREYDLTVVPVLFVPTAVVIALMFEIRGPELHLWAMTGWTAFLGAYLCWVMAYEYLKFEVLHRLKSRVVDTILLALTFVAILQASKHAHDIQRSLIWLAVVLIGLVAWEAYTVWKGHDTYFGLRIERRGAGPLGYRLVASTRAVPHVIRHWQEYRYWLVLDGGLIGIVALFWLGTSSWANVLSPAFATLITGTTATIVGIVNVFRYRVVLRGYHLPGVVYDVPHELVVNPTSALLAEKFNVALSFPGEQRAYVAEVANGLRDAGVKVFYDAFYEAELASPNLDVVLQTIYHDNSDLIVVFLCEEYQVKEWCGLEWRAVRDLIKRKRAASVMLVRFDDAQIPGLFSIDGYIDVRERSPSEVVEIVRRRVTANQVSSREGGQAV